MFAEKIDLVVLFFFFFLPRGLIKQQFSQIQSKSRKSN